MGEIIRSRRIVECPICKAQYYEGIPMQAKRRCGRKIMHRGMVRGYCMGLLEPPRSVEPVSRLFGGQKKSAIPAATGAPHEGSHQPRQKGRIAARAAAIGASIMALAGGLKSC